MHLDLYECSDDEMWKGLYFLVYSILQNAESLSQAHCSRTLFNRKDFAVLVLEQFGVVQSDVQSSENVLIKVRQSCDVLHGIGFSKGFKLPVSRVMQSPSTARAPKQIRTKYQCGITGVVLVYNFQIIETITNMEYRCACPRSCTSLRRGVNRDVGSWAGCARRNAFSGRAARDCLRAPSHNKTRGEQSFRRPAKQSLQPRQLPTTTLTHAVDCVRTLSCIAIAASDLFKMREVISLNGMHNRRVVLCSARLQRCSFRMSTDISCS